MQIVYTLEKMRAQKSDIQKLNGGEVHRKTIAEPQIEPPRDDEGGGYRGDCHATGTRRRRRRAGDGCAGRNWGGSCERHRGVVRPGYLIRAPEKSRPWPPWRRRCAGRPCIAAKRRNSGSRIVVLLSPTWAPQCQQFDATGSGRLWQHGPARQPDNHRRDAGATASRSRTGVPPVIGRRPCRPSDSKTAH